MAYPEIPVSLERTKADIRELVESGIQGRCGGRRGFFFLELEKQKNWKRGGRRKGPLGVK